MDSSALSIDLFSILTTLRFQFLSLTFSFFPIFFTLRIFFSVFFGGEGKSNLIEHFSFFICAGFGVGCYFYLFFITVLKVGL